MDSFSIVFTPPISVLEVNISALPISSTTSILRAEQCEYLGNVFGDFPTLTEGRISQLDTSLTGFDFFMIESSFHALMNSAVQTESCSVTIEIQLGLMSMVSTVPASIDEQD